MLIKDIMNFLFPPSCYICGNRLSCDDRIVCFECLSKVEQTDYHLFQHNILERIFWGHIPIEKAAALGKVSYKADMPERGYGEKIVERLSQLTEKKVLLP